MQLSRPTAIALRFLLCLPVAVWLTGCEPEVGSQRWCEKMRDKARGDWTANEAIEFARSCILQGNDE